MRCRGVGRCSFCFPLCQVVVLLWTVLVRRFRLSGWGLRRFPNAVYRSGTFIWRRAFASLYATCPPRRQRVTFLPMVRCGYGGGGGGLGPLFFRSCFYYYGHAACSCFVFGPLSLVSLDGRSLRRAVGSVVQHLGSLAQFPRECGHGQRSDLFPGSVQLFGGSSQ